MAKGECERMKRVMITEWKTGITEWKCDKCGRVFTYIGEQEQDAISTLKMQIDNSEDMSVNIDLCPECMNEFTKMYNKWIDGEVKE